MTDVLAPWHDFYTLLGAASAPMVGLLFVAASVAGGVFSGNRPAALRIFLSASVVHFATVLALCLIVLAPVPGLRTGGALVSVCGVFGLGYSALSWRDTVRDGLSTRIDLEDRIWYAVLPAAGYVVEAGAGVTLAAGMPAGCILLAIAAGGLLMVAIHNAWDITVWSVTMRGG